MEYGVGVERNTHMKNYKTAMVTRPYRVSYKGWDIEVPVGAMVSNKTACGPDDGYRFWIGWSKQVRELTGFPNSTLAHDLTYYGLNVPAEFCSPYEG